MISSDLLCHEILELSAFKGTGFIGFPPRGIYLQIVSWTNIL